MTREEAITTLKEMHDSFDRIHENTNCEIGYEQMTALDMAIEGLKSPQTDYISRADAIEAVRGLSVLVDEDEDFSYFEEALKALPSADAVPQLRQTDTLIIADALRYLAKDTERHLVDRTRADALRQQFLKYGASMCKGGVE